MNYEKLSQTERREVRLQYIEQQGGMCQHCNMELNDGPCDEIIGTTIDMKLFPKGFLDHPVHLHHDHETGMTIGAVHARCNAVLWQYYGE